jgi:hypothetical protein
MRSFQLPSTPQAVWSSPTSCPWLFIQYIHMSTAYQEAASSSCNKRVCHVMVTGDLITMITKYYQNDQIKEYRFGKACIMYGRNEKRT